MYPEIESRQAEIAGICRRFGVVRLDVFGSAAKGADFDPERSDADFLVEFGRPEGMNRFHQYFDCKFALEDMLGRSVDLVEPAAVSGMPHLKAEIERSREPVYEA